MRIAIVGTGISGLTAAYILHKDHQVTVFDSNNYIGGHTNTIDVIENDKHLAIDTGFIVFNKQNYPNLTRLFDILNIQSRNTEMSFSVNCAKTGLEYNGSSINQLFSQRRNIFNPSFLKMLKDIIHFHKNAPNLLGNDLNDTMTISEFTSQYKYSEYFVDKYLIPLGASLWSCPAEKFRQFPVKFVLEFLNNHCMLQIKDRPQWKTVSGGSNQYVKKLVSGFKDDIYLKKGVKYVTRKPDYVELTLENGDIHLFDEVILACHSDQSLKMVTEPAPGEKDLLSQFKYMPNEAVLHTDTSLLPKKKMNWASWNYYIPKQLSSHASVTYNMNILQGVESDNTYCVSLNQTENINPTRIIRRINYHHPMFQPGRDKAQAEHESMIRRRRISYCGAYWGYGFHEDGITSALSVCKAFDKDLS